MPLLGAAHLVSPPPLLCTSHPFLSPLPPKITHQVLKWSLCCWTQWPHFGAWCHPASVWCLLSSYIFPFIWVHSSGCVTSPLLFSLCRALLRDPTSSLIFFCQSRAWEADPGHLHCDVPPGQASLHPTCSNFLFLTATQTSNPRACPRSSLPRPPQLMKPKPQAILLLSTRRISYYLLFSLHTPEQHPSSPTSCCPRWALKSILTQLECQRSQCIPNWQLPWVSLASRISSNPLNMVQALNNLNAD